ncbi:hypothetical protein [Thalassospira alkalitolerans]|uniref:hypothetical protein n=1 Tax=Thalassospira alkalitolerans TaxID=1293890 RepID=UPI0030EB3E65|tara:strand:+ start:2187 stop:2897 length:711 start_codon:yes stop_codon:yes gene_type:complete
MSRVSIKEINHSDAVDISDPNSTLDNWTTASGNINATNIREEALDEVALQDNSVEIAFSSKSTQSYADFIDTSYSSTPISVGGETFSMGTFDVSESTTSLVIRLSFGYRIDLQENQFTSGNPQPGFCCVLQFSLDGGTVWAPIDETERKYGFDQSVSDGQIASSASTFVGAATTRPFEINADGLFFRGSHTISHLFSAVESSQVTIGAFVKVFGGTSGTTAVRIKDVYMTSEMYGR